MKMKSFGFGARQAFTLVELGVVIVILSILLSFVMVGRSIIDNAKIGKMQEGRRSFINAITIFRDAYDCFPGDCGNFAMNDVSNVPTPCFESQVPLNSDADRRILLGTGLVETAAKRTCAMREMQSAGFMDGINIFHSTLEDLAKSDTFANVIVAKGVNNAFWDIRSATGGIVNAADTQKNGLDAVSEKRHMPFSAGSKDTTQGFDLSLWHGHNMLVLAGGSGNIAAVRDATTSAVVHALSARMARKLDSKFDTGGPYDGNMIARHRLDQNGCTTTGNTSEAPRYLDSNAIGASDGCIVAFLIP